MALTEFQTEYVGTRGRLFRLALTSSLLTVLTLGLYRFWMKTRLRRYYWSAIRPGGQPLEYVGEPLEKLLGFLIAVVILAFYIGIVNLLLMFLSFSLLQGNFAAYALSFVGVIPVMFYARYRARRYILARTRWRGLRFGMAPGAWGYAGRAFLHWSITILTLGLLWPRMTFALEKYRTDRTFFGTGQFVQGGHWQMLYRPFLPLLAGLVIAGIAVVLASWGSVGQAMLVGAVGTLWALYGLAHYRVHSFRLLTNTKSLGGIGFRAQPRPWRVIRIYVLGNLIVGLLMSLFLTALLAALGGAVHHRRRVFGQLRPDGNGRKFAGLAEHNGGDAALLQRLRQLGRVSACLRDAAAGPPLCADAGPDGYPPPACVSAARPR